MKQIIQIIDNKLFAFEPIDNADWEFVSDKNECEKFLYSQQVKEIWLDLREHNSLILSHSMSADEEQDWKVLCQDIAERLDELGYGDYANDVQADLENCYLNIKHKANHPLWNMLYKAYKNGVFPCGWKGKFPKGKLVVFHPKYQAKATEIMPTLVANFFEKWENLAKNASVLDEICAFFHKNAQIHSDKGDDIVGIEAIRAYFQDIANDNSDIKLLWHKQLSNNKNYFEARFGIVLKTKNTAIKLQSGTMCFSIENEHIIKIEIVK
ncbi:MAG: nuclear transport factor 2 family protein [Capnocytophaga sp.]|nr:nuclear transport factor 2 family protein [Capnocytophaga sp.]